MLVEANKATPPPENKRGKRKQLEDDVGKNCDKALVVTVYKHAVASHRHTSSSEEDLPMDTSDETMYAPVVEQVNVPLNPDQFTDFVGDDRRVNKTDRLGQQRNVEYLDPQTKRREMN